MNNNHDRNSNLPAFTVISAIYNVEMYLEDFLASLDAQTLSKDQLQIVLVDDGSTDNSLRIITEWSQNYAGNVLVLSKENGGQASARNLGLEHAKGTWVTFSDPDDYLDSEYFAFLWAAISADKQGVASMFATHLITHNEKTGIIADTHALRKRFRDGDRIVDLERSPDFFHMSAGTAVLRREQLEKHGLKFQESLKFSFEDAQLISSYLLRQEKATIGYVSSAKYFYRKRAAGDSSVQLGSLRPEKYTDVLKHGHLDLLMQAKDRHAGVPLWLQYLLLYDIFWYFRGDRSPGAASRSLDDETVKQFHEYITEIVACISDEAIHTFDIMATDRELRDVLLLGYKHETSSPSQVVVERVDVEQKLTLLRYQYSGECPAEDIRVKGLKVVPKWSKSQAVVFFGRRMFSRRYLWIPATGTFSVHLNEKAVPLELGNERRPTYILRPSRVSKILAGVDVTTRHSKKKLSTVVALRRRGKVKQQVRSSLRDVTKSFSAIQAKLAIHRKSERQKALSVRKFASRPTTARRYKNAWILMDRVDRANDNGEHLYRYLMKNHPNINAWFVLKKGSSDWHRLQREGFKLLAFGSLQWKAALLNADNYISSHLDKYITHPLEPKLYGKQRWQFTFLQHGVTLHDQSRWFNSKQIELFIAATNAEYESLVGENTRYKFTAREVKLTGFPRHDELLRRLKKADKPSRILIAPTWRNWLAGEVGPDGRRGKVHEFAESDYAYSWRSLCASEELATLANSHGLRISLLPHPSMEQYVDEMALPEYVELLSWDDMLFSELLATAAAVVTDYSSTAFDAAYAGLPLVYFQFDREHVLSGAHIYEKGYFDYEMHGFGPIVVNTDDAVSAIADALHHDETLMKYVERQNTTFPHRDGRNCERVFAEIDALHREVPFYDAVTVAGDDSNEY